MKSVHPSEIRGTVNAPASKSMTVRAVAAALLSQGAVEIVRPSFCGDALSALGIAREMKAKITEIGDAITIAGRFPRGIEACGLKLDCGESGLCMRMFTPIAALSGEETTLTASGTLAARPMDMVEQLGGSHGTDNDGQGLRPSHGERPLEGRPHRGRRGCLVPVPDRAHHGACRSAERGLDHSPVPAEKHPLRKNDDLPPSPVRDRDRAR